MARKRTENDLVASSGAASAPSRRKTVRRVTRTATPASTPETSAATTELQSAQPAQEIRYEEIAQLAYSYWEGRGRQGGSAEEDWARAEHELRGRTSAAVASA